MRRVSIGLLMVMLVPNGAGADPATQDCGEFACVTADIHVEFTCLGGSGGTCSGTVNWEAHDTSVLPAGALDRLVTIWFCPPIGYCDVVREESGCTWVADDGCSLSGSIPFDVTLLPYSPGCGYRAVLSDVTATDGGALLNGVTEDFDLFPMVYDQHDISLYVCDA